MMRENHSFRKALIGVSSLVVLSVAQVSWAGNYTIDVGHSNVGFVARHLVSKVNGDFKKFNGTIAFDAEHPENSKITAKIDASTINTNEKKRDVHLRGDDFFAVKKFPTISFESTKISSDGPKKYKMLGNLTMHGVTRPEVFEVEYLGETDDPWGGHRAGFTATSQIDRKNYGINWNKALDKGGFVLGDEVTINLNIEALQKKAGLEALEKRAGAKH